MKIYCWIIGLSLLMVLQQFQVHGQNPEQASASGYVYAEVIDSYASLETTEMNFGRFSPGHVGGEITLSPEGILTVDGSIVVESIPDHTATVLLSGDGNGSFYINLPDLPVMLTHTASSRTLKVSNWRSLSEGIDDAGFRIPGMARIYVGATIEVGSMENNPPGIYEGSYSIVFDFN